MAKHLLENAAAEKEANDVGFRYMNSNDVLSDMIRDFGGPLHGVRVHDDAAADAKVRSVGRDGLASGKDVYMREGSLSDGDPASKGLLAHELTHVMQQDGGTQESVDYGSEQGGLKDWFRSKFTRKGRQQAAFAAAMPKLENPQFDASAMSQHLQTFTPEMQGQISADSQDRVSSDGDRFGFMRGGKKDDGTGRFNYFAHLKAAGRKANIATMRDLAEGVEAMPDTTDFGGFKGMRGLADGTQTKGFGVSDEAHAALQERARQAYGVYQDRGVETTRAYLAHLAESPESMEALRQSSAMYSQLGTYSDANKKGLVGGRLEADHRAMNDMILRSFGSDAAMSTNSARPEDTGMQMADQKKMNVLVQTMGAMQPAILKNIMDPDNPDKQLTPQEAQMAQLFSDFFAQLHGDEAPAPAAAAPASAPAQQPFTPGLGPKDTMYYRSDEIGALAADPHFEIDPTSSDPKMMAVIARKQYDKIKALQRAGADHEEIQRAVLEFKEARERMGWK